MYFPRKNGHAICFCRPGAGGHDGLSVMGVFAPLFLIEADHVTTILNVDFSDFERGGILVKDSEDVFMTDLLFAISFAGPQR
jgi:hypothetical protein